jgi:hypothetical protein
MQVTLANDETNAAGDRNQGLSTNVSNTFLVGLGNASVEGSFAPLRCTALISHTFTFEPPQEERLAGAMKVPRPEVVVGSWTPATEYGLV